MPVDPVGAEPQLLTLSEFSARSRLSPATIHRLKDAGKIPFVQPAGKRGASFSSLPMPLSVCPRAGWTDHALPLSPVAKMACAYRVRDRSGRKLLNADKEHDQTEKTTNVDFCRVFHVAVFPRRRCILRRWQN